MKKNSACRLLGTFVLVSLATVTGCFPPEPEPHHGTGRREHERPTVTGETQPAVKIFVCYLANEQLTVAEAIYDSNKRDTLVGGVPFREAYRATTPPYAAEADWYTTHEPIILGSRRYMKHLRPLFIPPDQLRRVASQGGIPLFAEMGVPRDSITVLYVPIRPGCEFMPYRYLNVGGTIR